MQARPSRLRLQGRDAQAEVNNTNLPFETNGLTGVRRATDMHVGF